MYIYIYDSIKVIEQLKSKSKFLRRGDLTLMSLMRLIKNT